MTQQSAPCPSCEGSGIMRLREATAFHRKGARFKCGACNGTGQLQEETDG